MKKNLTKIAGIALASLSLLLVGCPGPNNGTNNKEPTPGPTPTPTVKPDADADTIHAMILPHGTEAVIPSWEKASNALATDLPDFVTNFSDYKEIKIINNKGREVKYKTQELNDKTNRTAKLKEEIQKAIDNNSFEGKKTKKCNYYFW